MRIHLATIVLAALAPAALGAPGPGPRSAQRQQAAFEAAAADADAVASSWTPETASSGGSPSAAAAAAAHQLSNSHPAAPLRERYDGHQVWRIDWTALPSFTRSLILSAIDYLGLDVWRATSTLLDVRVPPECAKVLSDHLPKGSFSTFVADVQALVEAADPGDEPDAPPVDWNVTSLSSPFHDAYHTLDDMHTFGDALVAAFPNIITSFDVGTTAEGRTIRAWSATIDEEPTPGVPEDGDVDDEEKYEFVVQANQHAREWVSSSAAMYFLHSIVLEGAQDPTSHAAQLLRTFTFTVIPVVNPDGFAYTHEHSRMWKKNRQDVGGLLCKGIDLNGNWGYKFRPSRLACGDSYSGQTAFEAHETRAVADYLMNGTDLTVGRTLNIKAFVDLHSYGQLFMFPFSYSCAEFPHDAENLMEAGLGVAKAMRTTAGGEGYQTGQACDLTYRATGDVIDYAYAVADVRWSYSAELRDTGTYGFVLPPRLIRPTGAEISAGLRYLATFIFDTEIDD